MPSCSGEHYAGILLVDGPESRQDFYFYIYFILCAQEENGIANPAFTDSQMDINLEKGEKPNGTVVANGDAPQKKPAGHGHGHSHMPQGEALIQGKFSSLNILNC